MDAECILEDPTNDIGYLIWKISKFWQRGKHRSLDEFSLTGPQLEMLGGIYHMTKNKIKVTQIILSQEMDVDPMTTSTILRNLEKKGLISRKESETDTRARIVELTEEGTQTFLTAIAKVKSIQNQLFENIDKEALRTQLQILLQEMDKIKQ